MQMAKLWKLRHCFLAGCQVILHQKYVQMQPWVLVAVMLLGRLDTTPPRVLGLPAAPLEHDDPPARAAALGGGR